MGILLYLLVGIILAKVGRRLFYWDSDAAAMPALIWPAVLAFTLLELAIGD